MEDRLVRVLVRLVRIGDSLGDEAFERAVARALHAIGEVAMEEAEAGAIPAEPVGPKIIPFPAKPKRVE